MRRYDSHPFAVSKQLEEARKICSRTNKKVKGHIRRCNDQRERLKSARILSAA